MDSLNVSPRASAGHPQIQVVEVDDFAGPSYEAVCGAYRSNPYGTRAAAIRDAQRYRRITVAAPAATHDGLKAFAIAAAVCVLLLLIAAADRVGIDPTVPFFALIPLFIGLCHFI